MSWFICSNIIIFGSVFSQVDGDLRLAGSNFSNEGRVEIYHNGKWGTVCDDWWTIKEANVVCHQLGYKGAHYSYCCAHFGAGQDPIWMDDVVCAGNESSLRRCHFSGWRGHNCHHTEDVGVVCLYEGKTIYHWLWCFILTNNRIKLWNLFSMGV